MVDELIPSLNWLSRNAGASDGNIHSAEKSLHARFPEPYKSFLRRVDGGNARTSRGDNVCFFSTRELPEINAAAAIDQFLPGWLIVASDLGGKSYLMRKKAENETIVSCFDEQFGDGANQCHEVGKDFFDFLRSLSE
jgi:hypothetical protein